MVEISTADRTDGSSLRCQTIMVLIIVLLAAMATRSSSVLHQPCKQLYKSVCSLIHLLFVINKHDIIVVKMLCMHKQCVPGLHFPPPQNTGLGTRLGWSSNKLTLLVSGYAVVALAVYLAVSSSLSLLKCSTTCLHLARTVDSQLAFSAIWTERFNV